MKKSIATTFVVTPVVLLALSANAGWIQDTLQDMEHIRATTPSSQETFVWPGESCESIKERAVGSYNMYAKYGWDSWLIVSKGLYRDAKKCIADERAQKKRVKAGKAQTQSALGSNNVQGTLEASGVQRGTCAWAINQYSQPNHSALIDKYCD